MKKVTGVGGIFFKCKDPKAINEWYKTHLGFDTSPYGTSFEWREIDDSSKKGLTQWNPFAENTKYFEPSAKDFMINYWVENLEALVEELRKENVTIVDKIESYDYGKFVHILDIEGNKIQLWEPKWLDYDNSHQPQNLSLWSMMANGQPADLQPKFLILCLSGIKHPVAM